MKKKSSKPTKKQRCVVLGAGGHARVILEMIAATSTVEAAAILERDATRWGQELMGVPIRGNDELLDAMQKGGISYFVVAVGGVGDNRPRRRLYERALRAGLQPIVLQHPSAVCSRWASVGPGTVLMPRAVVNAGAIVGANVILNTASVVEHDCRVGDHAHIASGACLASGVDVQKGAHIGAGAVVKQLLTIGENAIVGAGAVVVRNVTPDTTVVGNPARALARVGTN